MGAPRRSLEDLTLQLARGLVSNPGEVQVERSDRGSTTVISLSVAQEDLGQVIGRGGRVAHALRAVVKAAGREQGRRAVLDIVD
jgi:hypothetical protein